MIKKELVVINETGLHARPAAQFVKAAGQFQASIAIFVGDRKINAKSILSVLSGGITKGTKITLEIDGPDEQAAEVTLTNLIESGFGE
jgi:phosphocarrier protein HPr